jgi:hypothetical protein
VERGKHEGSNGKKEGRWRDRRQRNDGDKEQRRKIKKKEKDGGEAECGRCDHGQVKPCRKIVKGR